MNEKKETMRLNQKKDQILISVIIPFYSNVIWLEEAVDSVLNQDYTNYEIIVVNDGSKEDLTAFLEHYGDKIVYYSQENGGAASARNTGIKNAQGEYIAFLDSDDLWKPNKLSVQIQKMQEYDAAWSYTDYQTFGKNVKTERKEMWPFTKEGIYANHSPYIGTPTVMIKTATLKLGNLFFAVDLRYGQDSFLWEQIKEKQKVLYIPKVLSSVRMRGTNAGKRASVQLRARVILWKKCLKEIPNYKRQFSLLYRMGILLCRLGFCFVKDNKGKWNEFVAKLFYFTPYCLFRLDRKIHKKNYIN